MSKHSETPATVMLKSHAVEYTEHIYQNEYRSHASQWQWALDNLPSKRSGFWR